MLRVNLNHVSKRGPDERFASNGQIKRTDKPTEKGLQMNRFSHMLSKKHSKYLLIPKAGSEILFAYEEFLKMC